MEEVVRVRTDECFNRIKEMVGPIPGALTMVLNATIQNALEDMEKHLCATDDATHGERITALARETVEIWPSKQGEFRMSKHAAIRDIKDALHKVARQAAYERRDEIEKLKRKLCVYEHVVSDLIDARDFNAYDARALARKVESEVQSIDAEPVRILG